ncbi:MAG TPA: hypothetical protein VI874_04515, partial [Candidatus Norongarragalinales archaeon]|nr:hypothetical protein [Candidatus Norongarragalinales archaeon]
MGKLQNLVILGFPFVLDDDGRILLGAALQNHDQPANASVAVPKGVDQLKVTVKPGDGLNVLLFNGTPSADEAPHLFGNVLRVRQYHIDASNAALMPGICSPVFTHTLHEQT